MRATMKVARLLKLAKRLDKVPPKRFDITRWVGPEWKGRADLSCGTVACALGWATTIPEFRKAGLKLRRRSVYDSQGFVALSKKAGGEPEPRMHEDSLSNAAVFFGLTDGQARQIFWPAGYDVEYSNVTPALVASRIRRMVTDYRQMRRLNK